MNWHLVMLVIVMSTFLQSFASYQSQKHQYPPLLPFELVMSCGSEHSTVAIVLGMFSEIRHNKCLTTVSLYMMTRLLLNNTFELQLRTPGGTAPVRQNFIATYPGQILEQAQ